MLLGALTAPFQQETVVLLVFVAYVCWVSLDCAGTGVLGGVASPVAA